MSNQLQYQPSLYIFTSENITRPGSQISVYVRANNLYTYFQQVSQREGKSLEQVAKEKQSLKVVLQFVNEQGAVVSGSEKKEKQLVADEGYAKTIYMKVPNKEGKFFINGTLYDGNIKICEGKSNQIIVTSNPEKIKENQSQEKQKQDNHQGQKKQQQQNSGGFSLFDFIVYVGIGYLLGKITSR